MFRRILVPLDGSPLAECALRQAAALALPYGARLLLLRVVDSRQQANGVLKDNAYWRSARAEASAYLLGLEARLRDLAALDVHTITAEGDPAARILACAREQAADLVVLSTHGQGGSVGLPFGRVAQGVLAAAERSVLTVHPGDDDPLPALQPYRKIMVPLDGSPRSEGALCLAASIAAAYRAALLMVHVVPVPEMTRRYLARREGEVAERMVELNLKAARSYLAEMETLLSVTRAAVQSRLVVSSRVARVVQDLAEAESVDLLLLSAHGYSHEGHWLYGGVAGSLLAHSRLPLLVFQDGVIETAERPDWGATLPARRFAPSLHH